MKEVTDDTKPTSCVISIIASDDGCMSWTVDVGENKL